MSRRSPISRYVLPESNDFNVQYACVPVPIDINHRAAFWGQLYALSSPRVWQNDEAHSAIDAAGVWKNVCEQIVISDGCNADECPNGITLEIDPDDENNTSGTIHDVPSWNCPAGNVDVMLARVFGVFLGAAHMGFRFRKDGVTVGVDVPVIRVMTFATSPGNHISFTWSDCLGNVDNIDYGPGTDEASFDDMEITKFNVETTDSFFMVVTMPRGILCTPS